VGCHFSVFPRTWERGGEEGRERKREIEKKEREREKERKGIRVMMTTVGITQHPLH
jgi:hypothetical protein